MNNFNRLLLTEARQLAYELVDPIFVDDIVDVELAQRVLRSVTDPALIDTLPLSLQDRVRTIANIVVDPSQHLAGEEKQKPFRVAVLERTAKRIEALSKFQADYIELVDSYLDPAPIDNEDDAKALTEALKSIVDPTGNHVVAHKYQKFIDDLKYLYDSPEEYAPPANTTRAALEKARTEQIRFIEIIQARIEKRIAELSSPTGIQQTIKDSKKREEIKKKNAEEAKALEAAAAAITAEKKKQSTTSRPADLSIQRWHPTSNLQIPLLHDVYPPAATAPVGNTGTGAGPYIDPDEVEQNVHQHPAQIRTRVDQHYQALLDRLNRIVEEHQQQVQQLEQTIIDVEEENGQQRERIHRLMRSIQETIDRNRTQADVNQTPRRANQNTQQPPQSGAQASMYETIGLRDREFVRPTSRYRNTPRHIDIDISLNAYTQQQPPLSSTIQNILAGHRQQMLNNMLDGVAEPPPLDQHTLQYIAQLLNQELSTAPTQHTTQAATGATARRTFSISQLLRDLHDASNDSDDENRMETVD